LIKTIDRANQKEANKPKIIASMMNSRDLIPRWVRVQFDNPATRLSRAVEI
jgi:hypothetical protein